jgi:two-component system, NarL family, nitrate/nitrite response regulator NarL
MLLQPAARYALIVDDHPLVRDGLIGMLERAGLRLHCDGATDMAHARRALAGSARYDLLLVDQRLPDGEGMSLLAEARATQPRAAGVLLSGVDDAGLASRARQVGAAAFLPKSLEPAQMVAAVERVLAGGTWFPERVRGAAPAFTERQVEVLQCASNGLSNKAIARELGVTERTVKDHLTVVYLRLGACNRAEAVARASAMGLVHVQA